MRIANLERIDFGPRWRWARKERHEFPESYQELTTNRKGARQEELHGETSSSETH